MSKDTIYREDAIKAINARTNWYQVTCNGKQIAVMLMAKDVNEILEKVPSADRPGGEVDAVKEYERQVHNLEQGYITIGEFDERIEPLRHLCYGRPQGEWIKEGCAKGSEMCNQCGFVQFECRVDNFCPYCGARMKGADDEYDK